MSTSIMLDSSWGIDSFSHSSFSRFILASIFAVGITSVIFLNIPDAEFGFTASDIKIS